MKTTRHNLIAFIFIALFVCLFIRLTSLHVFEKDFLQKQGDARTLRTVQIPAYRGMITDRHGTPLAVSTLVESVWLNPKEFDSNSAHLDQLLNLLQISKAQFTRKLTQYENKEFMYLKRHIAPNIADGIAKLKIAGVHFKSEYKRYYPTAEVSAQVVGFTDIDDKGIAGIEYSCNEALRGTSGIKNIIKDRLGREVEYIEGIQNKRSGQDLALSIDQRLQYLAYRELQDNVAMHNAKAGSVTILDVQTGEVLAMVNYPSFNPNDKISDLKDTKYRNMAVTDFFEPASAIKTFSMASVLETGKVNLKTLVDTNPGSLSIRGGVVKDLSNNGVMDVISILQKSSNIGISKLVLENPVAHLWDTYHRLGFGTTTNSNFPGEANGVLNIPQDEQQFSVATMSFGYGIAVTPLQLARAYATLGAGGIRRPVSFTKVNEPLPSTRVMAENTARQVIDILSIATNSKLSKAKVAGYKLAGKTGTARKLSKDGYNKGKHLAVFGGLAPAINPRFAIVVAVDEPSNGHYYSNQVAAPLFSKVAAGALRTFNIPPDLMERSLHIAHQGNKYS